MRRSTQREIGTIGHGTSGANPPPARIAARRYQGRKRGDAVAQLFEVASGHPQIVGTHDLVDESEGEREPLGVFQHTGEPLGADIGLHCGTLGEPPTHGGDRLIREVGLGGARVGVLE